MKQEWKFGLCVVLNALDTSCLIFKGMSNHSEVNTLIVILSHEKTDNC